MVGDQADFVSRLRRLLPNGWFPDSAPVLTGILTGIAAALAPVYSFIAYARLQTRIATATDGFLDLISFDFFGDTLPRKTGETGDQFRARIQAELALRRGTRPGLIQALTLLTGRSPRIFEPNNLRDTGAYNTTTMGYGMAGAYGSALLPNQTFVIAYRPIGQGVPNISGYGASQSAYNTPSNVAYITPSQAAGITDADIMKTIDRVKPLNAIIWTDIQS